MAVPPPRYAADGTIGAMASHADAVSGGRMPRTRSDNMRVPGQVVRERTLRRLNAPSSCRVFPGAGGKVDSTPGKAVRVKRSKQPSGDIRRRGVDIELGRGCVPEQVQQVRGNPLGSGPAGALRQVDFRLIRRKCEPFV